MRLQHHVLGLIVALATTISFGQESINLPHAFYGKATSSPEASATAADRALAAWLIDETRAINQLTESVLARTKHAEVKQLAEEIAVTNRRAIEVLEPWALIAEQNRDTPDQSAIRSEIQRELSKRLKKKSDLAVSFSEISLDLEFQMLSQLQESLQRQTELTKIAAPYASPAFRNKLEVVSEPWWKHSKRALELLKQDKSIFSPIVAL